jgi:hypothetical protein
MQRLMTGSKSENLWKLAALYTYVIVMFSCILDGEMMVWDPMLDKYLAFGTLKTAATGMPGFVWDSTRLNHSGVRHHG